MLHRATRESRTTRRILGGYNKVILIRINHSNAGFFAYFTFALNQLSYCERHGYLPVVLFGPNSVNGPNAYYEPARGDNTWDYYFEPVHQYTYQDIKVMIADASHPLCESDVTSLSNEDLHYMHSQDPSGIYGYAYGFYRYKTSYDSRWFGGHRREAHRLIRKHVRIKPEIREEVNEFCDRHMSGRHVLGIHMRGTDKGIAACMLAVGGIVPPEVYVPEIDAYREAQPDCKIFVATDQRQYLEFMRERYPTSVVFREALRSEGKLAPFQIKGGSNYQKGKEVLIDCLLLARCQFLLKCTSHVGEAAMWFNPDLPCIDLNYKRSHREA